MELIILGNTYFIDKNENSTRMIQKEVETIIHSGEYILSHFTIDDIDVFQDEYLYIQENLENIERLVVQLRTRKEFYQEVVNSLHNYLERAIPEMNATVGTFYQGKSEESWGIVLNFIDAFQWIAQSLEFINRESGQKFPSIHEFQSAISNMMAAINDSDLSLTGDIISFEIIPFLSHVNDICKKECEAIENTF